jgi:hypothetical protein
MPVQAWVLLSLAHVQREDMRFETAAEVRAAALAHNEATGHEIIACDDFAERTRGVACLECDDLDHVWETPWRAQPPGQPEANEALVLEELNAHTTDQFFGEGPSVDSEGRELPILPPDALLPSGWSESADDLRWAHEHINMPVEAPGAPPGEAQWHNLPSGAEELIMSGFQVRPGGGVPLWAVRLRLYPEMTREENPTQVWTWRIPTAGLAGMIPGVTYGSDPDKETARAQGIAALASRRPARPTSGSSLR